LNNLAYPKLILCHQVNKGGHFAAWKHPQHFAGKLMAAFKPVR